MTNGLRREELEKHADILRGLIRHENDVTNQRTTWLLVSQGILLTAAASFQKTHPFPAVVVGVVGIVISISLAQSLQNSFDSRQYMKSSWRALLEGSGYSWESFPPLDGGVPGLRLKRWLFPWFVLPCTFVLAWLALLWFFLRCNDVA